MSLYVITCNYISSKKKTKLTKYNIYILKFIYNYKFTSYLILQIYQKLINLILYSQNISIYYLN